jgi:endonuclease/exonuclease/phosphatase family metal-dependent hydrolase
MKSPLRIATFNLENLDDKPRRRPTLAERIAVMRPQLARLDADILCLQEVNGQEEPGQPRRLLALDRLLSDTPYAAYHKVSTTTADGAQVYDERNLVILSRFEIAEHHRYKHDFADAPRYRKVTAQPQDEDADDITWERPILYAKVMLDADTALHVVNLHLKSRLPSNIPGQKVNNYTWRTAAGWAEGFFVSSMKRVGQAMETRILIDRLFDEDERALVVVCGDFNAESEEVPMEAIRGAVENTGNPDLSGQVLVPCENTVPTSTRFTLLYHGKGRMIDHLLVSRGLLEFYRGTQVHNEVLHDESVAFATDKKYPESDHAPVVAQFDLPI